MDKYIEVNRSLWNSKTPIHVASEFYDVLAFKKGFVSINNIIATTFRSWKQFNN